MRSRDDEWSTWRAARWGDEDKLWRPTLWQRACGWAWRWWWPFAVATLLLAGCGHRPRRPEPDDPLCSRRVAAVVAERETIDRWVAYPTERCIEWAVVPAEMPSASLPPAASAVVPGEILGRFFPGFPRPVSSHESPERRAAVPRSVP